MKTESKQKLKRSGKPDWPLTIMTYIGMAFLLAFVFVPLWGWAMAFVNYTPGISIFESEFVGFSQFSRMFSPTSEFWKVMRNTLVMSLLNILTMPIPIVLAIMISEVRNIHYKKIVQTISAFPYFVSWIVVYGIFFALFSVDDGLLNNLLLGLGVIDAPFDLLGNADLTWIVQTFATLWKTMGYNAIIYLACINSIDPQLYEAVSIDGANTFQRIWNVTVPSLKPTFVVLLILSIGNMLSNGFDQYYVFSNPLNRNMIDVLDTYVYRLGIQNLDFSFATAVGIFKTVISVVLLGLANKISRFVTGTAILA